MPFTLSLNTNPMVNRFAEPDDLIGTVARDLRVRDLQLTHDFVDPSWPAPVIRRLTREWRAACERTGVRVTSGMTGLHGRRNHFGHPDADVRRYYVGWFKTFCEAIAASLALHDRLTAAGMAVPMRMLADVDHGDVTSANPDDVDPYAWARALASLSPIVHVKQSLMDKGGHRPFTAAFSALGGIEPGRLLEALRAGGGGDNEICLELSFREREPSDRDVISDIAENVAFWAPHVDTGAQDLRV